MKAFSLSDISGWRSVWSARRTIAVFLTMIVVFTPIVRLIEVPPKIAQVKVSALVGQVLTAPVFGLEDAPSTGGEVIIEGGLPGETIHWYEIDVSQTRTSAVVTVDREQLVLTVMPDSDDQVRVAVNGIEQEVEPGEAVEFALLDQPGWLNNMWKATWAALAATVAIYAATRRARSRRDHGESLAHMVSVMGSR